MKTLFSLLLALTAGQVYPGETTAPDLTGDTRSLLNAVHSSRLRAIMTRLNRLAYEREYTQLELDNMRAENVGDLVQAALQLSRAAERLPEIAAETGLKPEERITFSALARQLYRQTLALQDSLDQGQYSELESGYQQLRYTCNACHNLFRQR